MKATEWSLCGRRGGVRPLPPIPPGVQSPPPPVPPGRPAPLPLMRTGRPPPPPPPVRPPYLLSPLPAPRLGDAIPAVPSPLNLSICPRGSPQSPPEPVTASRWMSRPHPHPTRHKKPIPSTIGLNPRAQRPTHRPPDGIPSKGSLCICHPPARRAPYPHTVPHNNQ